MVSCLAYPAATLTDANLIVEVLSPSTEVYDRGEKFLFYQSLPSFCEYLHVHQDRFAIERRSRTQPCEWQTHQFTDLDAAIELSSLGVTFQLSAVYQDVVF